MAFNMPETQHITIGITATHAHTNSKPLSWQLPQIMSKVRRDHHNSIIYPVYLLIYGITKVHLIVYIHKNSCRTTTHTSYNFGYPSCYLQYITWLQGYIMRPKTQSQLSTTFLPLLELESGSPGTSDIPRMLNVPGV